MTLTVNGLSKRFGSKNVVLGLSFELREETIYGFLGPNGAGKTTTLKMIANQLMETAGQITLDGFDPRTSSQAQSRIYLMSTEDWLPANWSLKKNLDFLEDFYDDFDLDFSQELIELFKIDASKKLQKLSTGYQSVAKLIIALSVPADYVFLDEPVLGLDAGQRKKVNQALLAAYERRPRTLVISSHLVDEVAQLLEEIIIIDKGQLIRKASIDELLQTAYSLTGPEEVINKLSLGKRVVESSSLGKTRQVIIFGERPTELPSQVELATIKLQDYLIYVTKEV